MTLGDLREKLCYVVAKLTQELGAQGIIPQYTLKVTEKGDDRFEAVIQLYGSMALQARLGDPDRYVVTSQGEIVAIHNVSDITKTT